MKREIVDLFHNNGHAIDGFIPPYMRSAKLLRPDDESVLWVVQMMPDFDSAEWISDRAVDFADFPEAFREGLPLYVNVKEGVTARYGDRAVSIEGTAAIHRRAPLGKVACDATHLRRLTVEDVPLLLAMENDYDVLNMMEQCADILTHADQGFAAYGHIQEGQLLAFVSLSSSDGDCLRDCLGIGQVFTLPNARRRGLAGNLLRYALNENPGKTAYYDANPADNTCSNKLAASCGFVHVGNLLYHCFHP